MFCRTTVCPTALHEYILTVYTHFSCFISFYYIIVSLHGNTLYFFMLSHKFTFCFDALGFKFPFLNRKVKFFDIFSRLCSALHSSGCLTCTLFYVAVIRIFCFQGAFANLLQKILNRNSKVFCYFSNFICFRTTFSFFPF